MERIRMPLARRIHWPQIAKPVVIIIFVAASLLYFSNEKMQILSMMKEQSAIEDSNQPSRTKMRRIPFVRQSSSLNPLRKIPQGKRLFSEKHIPTLKDLDLFDPSVRFDEAVIFDQDPVFVSAWSSNHQQEAMILGNTFTNYYEIPPERKKLIVYDIGLSDREINDYTKKFGKIVQFRKFNFSKYPSYVKHLMQYRWKPLIIAEALLEFPVVWWLDSSIPFTNSKGRSFRRLHDSIKNDPKHLAFAIAGGTDHSIFAATHPTMFDFLPMPEDKAKNLTMADASHMLWFGTRATRGELLKWFVWCALEEECMAPPGSSVYCNFNLNRYLFYGNCNRFDQSAISIIATLLTDYNTEQYFMNRSLSPVKVPKE